MFPPLQVSGAQLVALEPGVRRAAVRGRRDRGEQLPIPLGMFSPPISSKEGTT